MPERTSSYAEVKASEVASPAHDSPRWRFPSPLAHRFPPRRLDLQSCCAYRREINEGDALSRNLSELEESGQRGRTGIKELPKEADEGSRGK